MPLNQTSGNVTTDAYGGGVAAIPNYIEDVFSTWLTSGTGAGQTVVNGNDFATNGGLIWAKVRSGGTQSHSLTLTNLGLNKQLQTDQSGLGSSSTSAITALNTDGFTFGTAYSNIGYTNVFWSFVKKKNFYTTATWTGNGSTQTLSHDLGSTPGCIIVKNITTAGSWIVWHRGLTSGYYIQLNGTGAQDNLNAARRFGNNSVTVDPTSTQFTVGDLINTSGDTWVAMIFAHNAGGFGLTGTDNVISCGSFTTDGSGLATVNLGYEPQWVLVKQTSSAVGWVLLDTMRGWVSGAAANTADDALLAPNTSNAESNTGRGYPTSTGFVWNQNLSVDYIYIAIRRGPMKVPTDATKVFAPVAATVNSANYSETTNFPVDLLISESRTGAISRNFNDRLRGGSATGMVSLQSTNTGAEGTVASHGYGFDYNTKVVDNFNYWNAGTDNFVYWNFQRAPSFFDEVCYTGTGSSTSWAHNLGVIPELKIIKSRSAAVDWVVGGSVISGVGGTANSLLLNSNAAMVVNSTYWSATDTNTTFSVRTGNGQSDGNGNTYVAYLFATCAGVSKVGSYTGTGTTKQIDCGFTAGARFVLIKRTDSTGDWYVWDTARGMTTLTDPYLLLNSTAAESATLGSVTTTTGGFTVNASILSAINTNAASYIFLAIA